jgi:hypothetical protein
LSVARLLAAGALLLIDASLGRFESAHGLFQLPTHLIDLFRHLLNLLTRALEIAFGAAAWRLARLNKPGIFFVGTAALFVGAATFLVRLPLLASPPVVIVLGLLSPTGEQRQEECSQTDDGQEAGAG